jgi:rubrerythrin
MAKKKTVTAEDIENIFEPYKEKIVASIKGYDFMWVLKDEIHEGETEVKLRCPDCSTEFESHSKSAHCPTCGRYSFSRIAKDYSKVGQVYDRKYNIIAHCNIDGKDYFANYFYFVKFSMDDYKIIQTKLVVRDLGCYDEYKESTYLFTRVGYSCWATINTPIPPMKKTKQKFAKLFNKMACGCNYNFFSNQYLSSEDYNKIIGKINSLETRLSAERADKAAVRDEIIPDEVYAPVALPTIEDLIGITVNKTSEDYLARKSYYKTHCLLCGHEWMIERENSCSTPIECPYCGNVRQQGHQNCRYNSKTETVIVYIKSTENAVWIKEVNVMVDETALSVTGNANFVAEINSKGKVSYYFYNKYSGKYVKSNSSSHEYREWTRNYVYRTGLSIILTSSTGLLKYSGILEYLEFYKQGTGTLYNYPTRTTFIQQIINFVVYTIKYPVVEKIIKADLVKEYDFNINAIDYKASTVEGAFKLSKAFLKEYKKERDSGNEDVNLIDYIQTYNSMPEIPADEATWMSMYDVNSPKVDAIREVVPALSISKIISYLERVRLMQQFYPREAILSWRDYLRACKSIGMDMTDRHVLYPRALKTEHDVVVAKQKLIQDESIRDDFMKAVEEYKTFEYDDLTYCIKVPDTMEEMFEEGRKLHHCCGQYIDDVARKKAIVLFLRRKEAPEEPYLSIEVTPNKEVRQVRGYNDTYIHTLDEYKEVSIFLKKWAVSKHLDLKMI